MRDESSSELEKLLLMAEKISETVNELHTKTANLRTMSYFSGIATYISFGLLTYFYINPELIFDVPLTLKLSAGIVLLSASTLGVYITYQYFSKIKRYRRDLMVETEMLHRLLAMIHEYKDHIHSSDLSYVDNAVLEMRLQRIKYSGKW